MACPHSSAIQASRSIVEVVEERASIEGGPNWASFPLQDANFGFRRGFRDVSFQNLHNSAIGTAYTLNDWLPESNMPFQSFAYIGPNDIRYPIIALAAARARKVMILPIPHSSPEEHARIVELTGCSAYLFPSSEQEAFNARIAPYLPGMHTVVVPTISKFLDIADVVRNDEEPPSDNALDDPWLVFHGISSTGDLKLFNYTQRMLASCHFVKSCEPYNKPTFNRYALRKWYTSEPFYNVVGMMVALALTIFLQTTLAVGPPGHFCTHEINQFLSAAEVKGALLSLAVLEDLLSLPSEDPWPKSLTTVQYINSSLPVATRRKLCARSIYHLPYYCSPEAGVYLTRVDEKISMFSYVSFYHCSGILFEKRMQGLHELVFVKSDQLLCAQIFLRYPDLDWFPSGELWIEHPVHHGFWRPVCHVLEHIRDPYRVFENVVQVILTSHDHIDVAFVEWTAFGVPLLFLQFRSSQLSAEDLQPYVDYINRCNDLYPGEVSTHYVIQTPFENRFARNYNGKIHRWNTFSKLNAQIVKLGLKL